MSVDYIVESDGSKRYLVAKDSESLGEEEYLFGCEFEFYPSQAYEQEAFLEELCSLSYSDVVVNEIFVPHFKDSKSCMQLKPDISLDYKSLELGVSLKKSC